jgi:hypothetical protein
MGEFTAERQTASIVLGTTLATVFGGANGVPPQYTVRVYQASYGAPGIAGTVNIVGYLMLQQQTAGYSTMGTMSPNGSIADFAVVAGNQTVGEVQARDPLFVVPPGYALTGLCSAGSLVVKLSYDWKLGRSV